MQSFETIAVGGIGDPASALTHLCGAILFAVLSVLLLLRAAGGPIRRTADPGRLSRIVSLSIFAAAAVVALVTSGIFHACRPDSAERALMMRFDSATIFLLIAATYTPPHVILFRGRWRWGFLSFIWTVTIACITLKTIYFDDVPRSLSLAAYLGVGWCSVLSAAKLWRHFGWNFILPIVLGGLAYTIGGVMNLVHFPNLVPGFFGPHEVFHIAVLIGLGFHWQFMDQIAAGPGFRIVKPQLGPALQMRPWPSELELGQRRAA